MRWDSSKENLECVSLLNSSFSTIHKANRVYKLSGGRIEHKSKTAGGYIK